MVRYSELGAARRGARRKIQARQQAQRSNLITAGFVGLDGEDTDRALISLDEVDDPISVVAPPVKIIPGSLVSVAVDHAGRPSRVLGPATVRPEGLDEDAEIPAPVVAMPELAPHEGMTEEEQQKLAQAVADVEAARGNLVEAEAWLKEWDEVRLPALQSDLSANRDAIAAAKDDLEEAFPTGPFNVGDQISQSASATLTAAALDAQDKANDAASAAQAAAEKYAAGEIGAAELRAAQDAEAKANAARDAAVVAANEHADTAASAAEQAALSGAQAYADQKKTEAITAAATDAKSKADAAQAAAIAAAEEHADLVADGASAAAIAAAAADAKAKADAAEQAAKTHANAQAAAAEQAAKTHATNEAARVKQEALTEAATDAQAKATAAADAAQQAAEAYALAQAEGLSGQALADAKADAQTKADAARDAAITAAETYADARKNEAIDAAALTAQTKADVAKQAAIDAAALDAQAKADAAASAAETAAKEHADLVAQGASADAIAAAAQDAKSKADAAQAAAIDAAKADLDALEVGGRNLLTGTSDEWQNLNLSSTTWYYQQGSDFAITPGETYTFSIIVEKLSEDDFPVNIHLGLGFPPGAYSWDMPYSWGSIYSNIPLGKRVSLTFTIPPEGGAYGDRVYFAFRLRNNQNPMQIRFRSWKLERGSKATDWTPAPEDVDAGIADAQAAADAADGKAKAAQSTADTAKARADQAVTNASNAHARADAAMTTADGKNTVTYDDVTTIPGPAPTTASGAERRQFDMHRNRAKTNIVTSHADEDGDTYQIMTPKGTVLAEWMWSGTSWVPVHMGDGMLRSLDVGKLTAGYGNLQTAVIQKLTAQLARLIEVDADKIVTGTIKGDVLDFQTIWAGVANLGRIITQELIANGAVTSEALNVVHEDPTTGYSFHLEPEGLTITNAEGAPLIVLRADMTNVFAVMDADGTTPLAMIDEAGNVTGQVVSADEDLFYRGTGMGELLAQPAAGVIARAVANGNASIGTSEGRVVYATFRTPKTRRDITITFNGYTSNGAARLIRLEARQSTGNSVTPANSSKAWWRVSPRWAGSFSRQVTMSMTELGWPLDATITVGIFAKSETSGETIAFSWGRQELVIEDKGPETVTQTPAPWVPSTGGGSGTGDEDDSGTRGYTLETDATWTQSYYLSSNVKYPLKDSKGNDLGNKRSYQGYYLSANGYLKSLIGFPNIEPTLRGSTIKSVKLRLKNGYTGSSAGATAVIGLHSYSSAPDTWGHIAGDVARAHFTTGSTRTIDIPEQYWAGILAGTTRGVTLYIASTSIGFYGWWDGRKAQWLIEYEK